MFDSKPLKDFDDCTWFQTVKEKLHSVYWKTLGTHINPVKKAVQWYVHVFRDDYDFDAHCIYAIIGYKLQRIEKALKSGLAVQEDKDMRALSVAIKLARRLKEETYETEQIERHEKKWGEMEHWTTPLQDSTSLSVHFSRPKAVFEQEKQQERKEFRECYERAYKKKDRETKWLFNILRTHIPRWWD